MIVVKILLAAAVAVMLYKFVKSSSFDVTVDTAGKRVVDYHN